MLGLARRRSEVNLHRGIAIAALCLASGCASSDSKSEGGTGGADSGLAVPCEMCNVYSYTCVNPGQESSTLSIEEMVEGGCRGHHLATEVELRCDPPQYCAGSQPCKDVGYSTGAITFGGKAQCIPGQKRVE